MALEDERDRKIEKTGEKWKAKSREVRDEFGISVRSAPLTRRHPRLLGVPATPRVVDLLNISEAIRIKRGWMMEERALHFRVRLGSHIPPGFSSIP